MSRWIPTIVRAGGIALLLMSLPLAADAAPQPLDLNALIAKQCGAPGYRPDSGCSVSLGQGSFSISETVRLGGCTTATVRNSVTFQGRGAGLMATTPRFTTAGTTIQWAGRPGGIMFDACGASFLAFRDLTLDAANAGIGIRVSADNQKSAISHFVEIRNVVIDGAAIGVYITGKNHVDQTDFVTLERVSLSHVGVGYVQDSQQSVQGRVETVEVTARTAGFEIRGGSLICDGCYVGSLPPGGEEFIAFHLTGDTDPRKPWEAHHQIQIEHSHMELTRGRFIVEDAGAHYPITLIGNSYGLHCPAPNCEMRILDSISKAPIVMIGDVVQGLAQQARGRICHRGPELIHLGVHQKPEVAALEWGCPP